MEAGGGGGGGLPGDKSKLPKDMKDLGKRSRSRSGSSSESNSGSGSGEENGGNPSSGKGPIGKYLGYTGHRLKQKGIKGIGGAYLGGQAKMAMKMFGAAAGITAGAASGDGKALAGGFTGYAAGKFAADKTSQIALTKRVEKNERYFAGAYQDYVAAHPNMSRDRIAQRTKAMLNMSDDQVNNLSGDERKYAQHVRAMQSTYKDAGIDKPDDKVMDTLKDIQSGKIYPN